MLFVDALLGLKLYALVDMYGVRFAVVRGFVTEVLGVNSLEAVEICFVFINLFWAVKLFISGTFVFWGLVRLNGFVAGVLIGGENVKLFASKLKLDVVGFAGGAYILGIGIWVLIERPPALGLNDWAFIELSESEFEGAKVCDVDTLGVKVDDFPLKMVWFAVGIAEIWGATGACMPRTGPLGVNDAFMLNDIFDWEVVVEAA